MIMRLGRLAWHHLSEAHCELSFWLLLAHPFPLGQVPNSFSAPKDIGGAAFVRMFSYFLVALGSRIR